MENLKKLISEVKAAEANINNLKRLLTTYKTNKERGGYNCKMGFHVNGFNDVQAVCIDELIFYKAVNESIEFQERLFSDKFKTVEAMEMLATNQVGEK